MDHYIEIRLLPDPEFSGNILMNALFSKFHRALSENEKGVIGVSMPDTDKTLGDRLRLHGSSDSLEWFMQTNWLKGLRDYTTVSVITKVPDGCCYRVVKRVQVKSNVERLYRRSVVKGWLTSEEAEQKISEHKDKRVKSPFVLLKSTSTDQTFRLFIQHGKLLDSPMRGKFSNYGLSQDATIPWF